MLFQVVLKRSEFGKNLHFVNLSGFKEIIS